MGRETCPSSCTRWPSKCLVLTITSWGSSLGLSSLISKWGKWNIAISCSHRCMAGASHGGRPALDMALDPGCSLSSQFSKPYSLYFLESLRGHPMSFQKISFPFKSAGVCFCCLQTPWEHENLGWLPLPLWHHLPHPPTHPPPICGKPLCKEHGTWGKGGYQAGWIGRGTALPARTPSGDGKECSVMYFQNKTMLQLKSLTKQKSEGIKEGVPS